MRHQVGIDGKPELAVAFRVAQDSYRARGVAHKHGDIIRQSGAPYGKFALSRPIRRLFPPASTKPEASMRE